MREIYLDNSATTRAYDEVREIVGQVMTGDYGNPSSLHLKGVEAEKYIKKSLEVISRALKCKDKEIFFTSGGTESDNLAIIGGAFASKRKGNHLITTKIEHPAVLHAMGFLETCGFEVTYLPVNREGIVTPEDVRNALREDTILVSTMHVNNEIGSVFPVEEIGAMLKKEAPRVLYHVDGVQAFGRYTLYPGRCGIDLYAFSGHKIHGPKGTGVLYVRDGVRLTPMIYGGGQQKGIRPGTENVPGIAGIGKAVELTVKHQKETFEKLREIKDHFTRELLKIDGVVINGSTGDKGAPHILNAGFSGVRAEVLLHSLEEDGIYVSSGSACASNHPGISETLKGIGVSDEYITSSIRFSFSEFTTMDEISETLESIKRLLPMLRKFRRF